MLALILVDVGDLEKGRQSELSQSVSESLLTFVLWMLSMARSSMKHCVSKWVLESPSVGSARFFIWRKANTMHASSVPDVASAGPVWEEPCCPCRRLSALLYLVCIWMPVTWAPGTRQQVSVWHWSAVCSPYGGLSDVGEAETKEGESQLKSSGARENCCVGRGEVG